MTHPNDKEYGAAYRKRLRDAVYTAYGNACSCCGESRRAFLTIDHIFGAGETHRMEITGHRRGRPKNFYAWLRRQGYPQAEFRLLCFNCNCGRERTGLCPHEEDRIWVADVMRMTG